eukprot:2426820-Rhodomonas_salina.1
MTPAPADASADLGHLGNSLVHLTEPAPKSVRLEPSWIRVPLGLAVRCQTREGWFGSLQPFAVLRTQRFPSCPAKSTPKDCRPDTLLYEQRG